MFIDPNLAISADIACFSPAQAPRAAAPRPSFAATRWAPRAESPAAALLTVSVALVSFVAVCGAFAGALA